MSLLYAAVYQLFAGNTARRSRLTYRTIIFCLLAGGIAYLGYYVTPTLQTIQTVPAVCLACSFIYCGTTVTYLCTAGMQRTVIQRLALFWYLPLPTLIMRRLMWLAYVPTSVLSIAISMPVTYVLLQASLEWFVLALVIPAALVTSVVFHTMIRTTKSVLWKGARFISVATLFGMLLLVWELLLTPFSTYYGYIVVAFMVILTTLSVGLRRAPVALCETTRARSVAVEWRSLGVVSAFILRALRTPRYANANIFLLSLLIGMSLLAWLRPVVPFDGVCVLLLLLVGTLAQEVRSLYKGCAAEGVLYGVVTRWISAIWLLVFANAAFFTAILLAFTVLWFPHDVGTEYMRILCVGAGFVAIGILAASLIVPHRDDVVIQLLSAVLYGSGSWLLLRIQGDVFGYQLLVLTGIVVVGCMVVSYVCERVRWSLSTRGKYAFWR